MTQHSIRLYEKEHPLKITTEIVNIIEETIKIVTNGKPNMVNSIGLVFLETIFHPQGGGQPSDKGKVNNLDLLIVREDKLKLNESGLPTIYHFLDFSQAKNQFKIGQTVEIKINEGFRLQCQRSHSAGHIIADILEYESQFTEYQSKTIQGNHFPGSEYIKMLMTKQPDDVNQFQQEINSFLNKLILADLPVFSCVENGRRHIKIGKFIRMCGGTHVTSSKEIKRCEVTKIRFSKNKEGQIESTIFYCC